MISPEFSAAAPRLDLRAQCTQDATEEGGPWSQVPQGVDMDLIWLPSGYD